MTSKIMQMALKQVNNTTTPLMLKIKQQQFNQLSKQNPKLAQIWQQLNQLITTQYGCQISNGMLRINKNDIVIFIAQHKQMFRIKSRLDWVYYDLQDLATNLDNDTIKYYYFIQLGDPNSYPNDWKRIQEEYLLKTHYANRVGRQTDFIDNI
jgi:hypothetical protein